MQAELAMDMIDGWWCKDKTDTVCRTTVTTDKSPAIDLLQRQSSGGESNLAPSETGQILNVGQERRRATVVNRRVISDEKRPLSQKGRCELGPMTEGGERLVLVWWTMRKGASAHRKQGSGRTWKYEKMTPEEVEMKDVGSRRK
jgi:hypothetical protein